MGGRTRFRSDRGCGAAVELGEERLSRRLRRKHRREGRDPRVSRTGADALSFPHSSCRASPPFPVSSRRVFTARMVRLRTPLDGPSRELPLDGPLAQEAQGPSHCALRSGALLVPSGGETPLQVPLRGNLLSPARCSGAVLRDGSRRGSRRGARGRLACRPGSS